MVHINKCMHLHQLRVLVGDWYLPRILDVIVCCHVFSLTPFERLT